MEPSIRILLEEESEQSLVEEAITPMVDLEQDKNCDEIEKGQGSGDGR